ncbi:MAG: hypothetical protein ACXAC8_03560 [Candidatus Hodarchaeales archaeon]
MSKERRNISQRKIRRIKRSTTESSFQLESETARTKPKGLAPNTLLYYNKIVFGAGSGTITGLLLLLPEIGIDLGITITDPLVVLMILISSLVLCVTFFRYFLKISTDVLDQKRVWLSGTFTFVVLFIVFASLIWMLPGPRF